MTTTTAALTADGLIAQLPALQRRLAEPAKLGGVMAAIADEVRTLAGYDRAIVLTVDRGRLLSRPCAPLADDASDHLRRICAVRPLRVDPGTPESLAIRAAEGALGVCPRRDSGVAAALDLDRPCHLALAPGVQAIALVIADRPHGPVELQALALLAHVAGLALERAIQRDRLRDLSEEMRYLTASAAAAVRETVDSPLAIPVDAAERSTFNVSAVGCATGTGWRSILSEREFEIAQLIAEGRSNRDIAGALHISAETVKGYVSRLMSKLGAANRVQVATRFLGGPA